MEVQNGTGIQVLSYANYVSLSAMEKTLVSEGFTEEVLKLPKWQGTEYRRVTGSSGQRHKDAMQHSQLGNQNTVPRM